MDEALLECMFTYHKPNAVQVLKYERIRASALSFAKMVNRETFPMQFEQEQAIKHIDQAVMWAFACIAREGGGVQ